MNKMYLPSNPQAVLDVLASVGRYKWRLLGAGLAVILLGSGSALAYRESNVAKTKHNLSVTGPGDVKIYPPTGPGNFATTKVPKQTQICIFCHTPHGGTPGVAPGWNRKLSNMLYIPYSSSSLSALDILGRDVSGVPQTPLPQPGGSSKLCLSCHDGTLAVGNVNVMWGVGTANSTWMMPMLGTVNADPVNGTGGTMPLGGYGDISGPSGVQTGFTRLLGWGPGFSRKDTQGNFWLDLTNDHPISVTYTHELAVRNGELRDVTSGNMDVTLNQQSVAFGPYGTGQVIGFGKRFGNAGYKPMAPLESVGPVGGQSQGMVQCASCHDPHLNETDPTIGNQKFLRMNRFQEGNAQPEFNYLSDIGCMACHDKNFNAAINGVGTNAGTWAYSSHSNYLVATQTYLDDPAKMREFPTVSGNGASTNLPVWKASCLNCHDTHTVYGARWLLREGTDSQATPKAGGNSAIEETCYQCHSSPSIVNPPAQDIKTDFNEWYHMSITLQDQQTAVEQAGGGGSLPVTEVHSIGGIFNDGNSGNNCTYIALSTTTNKCGPDGLEWSYLLGKGNLVNRHAECTDCHNPHRIVPFQSFEGHPGAGNLAAAPNAGERSTHQHTATTKHTNIASGALRGTFGVEPIYGGASFNSLPNGYNVQRGDPDPSYPLNVTDCAGLNKATCDGKTWVTREYEVCLKCHSDYGYTDSNTWPYTDLPYLGPGGANGPGNGLTPSGANGLTHYTNQAREFQAPAADQGEPVTSGDSGAGSSYSSNNHRSWHPVIDHTNRGLVAASGVFTAPWNNDIGNQTMYCSDCHGSNVSSTTSVIPDQGGSGSVNANWGPHGSMQPFILKGEWDFSSGSNDPLLSSKVNQQAVDLCFKCHDYNSYASGSGQKTGFGIKSVADGNNIDVNAGADGHQLHFTKIGKIRCDWCHAAVPHGFKNKGLLVNLNDVGPEAGITINSPSSEVFVSAASGLGYNAAPYYMNAWNKVINFQPSGKWTSADCGSKTGYQASGQSTSYGLGWMKSGNEACTNPP